MTATMAVCALALSLSLSLDLSHSAQFSDSNSVIIHLWLDILRHCDELLYSALLPISYLLLTGRTMMRSYDDGVALVWGNATAACWINRCKHNRVAADLFQSKMKRGRFPRSDLPHTHRHICIYTYNIRISSRSSVTLACAVLAEMRSMIRHSILFVLIPLFGCSETENAEIDKNERMAAPNPMSMNESRYASMVNSSAMGQVKSR